MSNPSIHPRSRQKVEAAIEQVWKPLGVRVDQREPVLVVWSPSHQAQIDVPLSSWLKVEAFLSFEVGEVGRWLRRASRKAAEKHPAQFIIKAALQSIAERTPVIAQDKILGQGLHFIDGTAVAVTGGRFLVKARGEPWAALELPRFSDYLLHTGDHDWLPWTVEELNRPCRYDPSEVVEVRIGLLSAAWRFRQDADYFIHGLLPDVYTLQDLFIVKLRCHTNGPTHCGKSKLLQGYYQGDSFAGAGGPYVANAELLTDASAAGIMAKFNRARLLLAVDEQELSEQEGLRGVIAMLRSATLGGAKKLRAHTDGRVREEGLNVPAIIASIEPLDEDADVNRWIVTELEKVAGHPDPEDSARRYLEEHSIDPAELRRCSFLWPVLYASEIRQANQEIRATGVPGAEKMDRRFVEQLEPLLAVAKAYGLPWDTYGEVICNDKAEYQRLNQEMRIGARLVDQLLHGLFFSAGGRRTTLAAVLESDPRITIPEAGLVVEEENGERKLLVNWEAAIRGPLAGSEFAKMKARRLSAVAKDAPGFVENSRQHYIGSFNARCTVFDLDAVTSTEPGRAAGSPTADVLTTAGGDRI